MKARKLFAYPLDTRCSALECSECGPLGVSLAEDVVADFLRHFNIAHHLGAAPV